MTIVERMAMAIYADSFRQYGTCPPDVWRKTSEPQRQFCRGQALAALDSLIAVELPTTYRDQAGATMVVRDMLQRIRLAG